jgi:uncharacterized membrane protein YsdA (DUF1294 family)/cold shock CspA family protein
MRKQGKVSTWKDGRGFGFIEPSAGGKQVFVHIRVFVNGSRRPVVGSPVSYEESRDAQGRIKAENVRSLKSGFSPGPASIAFVVAAVFLTGVAAIVMSGVLPDYVLWWYLGLSAVTFVFYAKDKAAAKQGGQRTPESSLHTLALVGGWPGALYARELLRHKSSKKSFRTVFRVTLFLNIIALVYLSSGYGARLFEALENILR